MTELVGLVVFLLLSFLAAGVGGAITARSVRTWYPTRHKPTGNPPSWLFGPVWSLLALIEIAVRSNHGAPAQAATSATG